MCLFRHQLFIQNENKKNRETKLIFILLHWNYTALPRTVLNTRILSSSNDATKNNKTDLFETVSISVLLLYVLAATNALPLHRFRDCYLFNFLIFFIYILCVTEARYLYPHLSFLTSFKTIVFFY